MKLFKIRASAISNITPLPRSKKDREAGVLSKTAQTYCKDWLREQPEFFNRRKNFSSKFTYKGDKVEDGSIEFAEKMLGYAFLFKNEEDYKNDFCTGTPDVIPHDCVIDLKNSWSADTFPYFETDIPNKSYWWQGQGYMWMTGRKHYKLIYTLMDAPPEQIESEARRYCYANYLDLDLYFDEAYEMFAEKLTYSDIPDKLRIKVFEFERDEAAIELIKDRVLACRSYINELLEKLNYG